MVLVCYTHFFVYFELFYLYMQQHKALVKEDIFAKKLNTLFIYKHFVPMIAHIWMKYYYMILILYDFI